MIKLKPPRADSSRISDHRSHLSDHNKIMDPTAARRWAAEADEYDESEEELYEEGAEEEPEYMMQDTTDKGKGRATPAQPATHPVRTTATAAPHAKPSSTSWTDLDLSLIVAFVSPIGNWLTGGDHIKNLFLVILLIFYLHQLIEAPWRLYQSSLPRTPAHQQELDAATAEVQALARTELRKRELFYLALTVISPLVGAYFLHHVMSTLGSAHELSWFSITLFVLATGVRPWSHLITRLGERTRALHDAVHYPPPPSTANETDKRLAEALDRLHSVEAELADLRAQTAHGARLQGVCDDLSEALGDLERGTQRTERRADLGRSELMLRIASLEAGFVQLEERRRKDAEELRAGLAGLPHEWAAEYARTREWIRKTITAIVGLPATLWALGAAESDTVSEKPKASPASPASPVNGRSTAVVPAHRENAAKHSPRLETIPEVENSDASSDGTYVSVRSRSRSRSGGRAKRPTIKVVTVPAGSLKGKGFELAQHVLLWPYRVSVRVLVAFVPPLQKIIPAL